LKKAALYKPFAKLQLHNNNKILFHHLNRRYRKLLLSEPLAWQSNRRATLALGEGPVSQEELQQTGVTHANLAS
jgi:hypothetical protein